METQDEAVEHQPLEISLEGTPIYIWVCPNGHYVGMTSIADKLPGKIKPITKKEIEKGSHNRQQCPHCGYGILRVCYRVTAMERVP